MNSTNVESEKYSDYFNLIFDTREDTLPKKLKPDNLIGALSEFLNVFPGSVQLCLVFHYM